MSSADQATTTDRREFRARFPWLLFAVGWACLALSCSLWIALWAAVRASDPSAWPISPCRFALMISVAPLLVLLCTCAAILEARRASVLLDPGGLVVTDWRRRQRRISWEDIVWLRTARWAGRSGGAMRVGTPTGSVGFPYPIDRPEALRQEIIARAGLTDLQKGWLRLTYRRAQASQEAGTSQRRLI